VAKDMKSNIVFSILIVLLAILAASACLATAPLKSCGCEIVRNPITVVNSGDTTAIFTIHQTGTAASWSTLTETGIVLGPKDSKVVDSFIKPACNIKGVFGLTTDVSSTNSRGTIYQDVIVGSCLATGGNIYDQIQGNWFWANKGWLLALCGILLLLLLILLAAYLLLEKDWGYYRRIRLDEPKITSVSGPGWAKVCAWLLLIVLVIALIIFIWVLGHYLKGATALINATSNQSITIPNASNTTLKTLSNWTISQAQNYTNNGSVVSSGATSLWSMLKSFIITYWPYLVFGFAVLLILVMLSPKKDSE
jgi:hypothetical protein